MTIPSMRGYSGQYLEYNDPTKYRFTFIEFAHSLSKICRFAGNLQTHYSVAQHSVLVSELMPAERDLQLQALLHDATEAFMSDVPAPVKYLIGPGYKDLENLIQRAIFSQFGLPLEEHPLVKKADRYLLSVERRDLIPEDLGGWQKQYWPDDMIANPIHPKITPLPDFQALSLFLNRANELKEIL